MRLGCSLCERKFTGKAQKHEKLIHQNICESICSSNQCRKSVDQDESSGEGCLFKQRGNVNQHIRTVHEENRFRNFSRNFNLRKPERILHQNIRQFECRSCLKKFDQSNHLDRHKISCCRCRKCEKQHKNMQDFRNHCCEPPTKKPRMTELPSSQTVSTKNPAMDSQFVFPTPPSCAIANTPESFTLQRASSSD